MMHRHGIWKLIAVTIVLTAIWMVVLPWLADRPATRQYRERLDAQGIDPAAMYYTELPPHVFADAAERQQRQ